MLLVKNGKDPDDLYNASLGFWLPPNTPYGNLQLKYMKIICRIDEANRKIADSWKFWKICSDGGRLPNNALDRHVLANENVVYMLRRAGDELVSMIWLLAKYENNRDYPSKIEIDCLGAVVSQKEGQRIALFSKHIELMQKLNDIANAFKPPHRSSRSDGPHAAPDRPHRRQPAHPPVPACPARGRPANAPCRPSAPAGRP